MEAEELRVLELRDAGAKPRSLQTKTTLMIGTALGRLIAAAAGGSVQLDISRLELAEETRSESGAKYRGLLEAAPDAIVAVNPGGEIVLLNVLAEKRFGYHREQLVREKVTNIIPEGFAERLIADGTRSAEEVLAQQIGTDIELIGRRKDRSEFPTEITLSPLESAERILVTAAIRDIRILQGTGLNPAASELELTESVLMKRAESTESILKALRAGGIQAAVDNFGTGYSSLS
jgi:PAS domain S-box-containing protein